MTRKKVKLAFITNDSARKATYKKRNRGLLKKVNELSTLCGIDTCAIIYSPYESKPEVWPVNPNNILSQFKKMPEMEQCKKMVNQESFLRQRIVKVKEQLKKQLKENREKEMIELMFQCLIGKEMNGLSFMDLNDLGWVINQYMKDVGSRIEGIKRNPAAAGMMSSAAGQGSICLDVREKKSLGFVVQPQLPLLLQQQWLSDQYVQVHGSNNNIGTFIGMKMDDGELDQRVVTDPTMAMMMMAYGNGGGDVDHQGGSWATSDTYSFR